MNRIAMRSLRLTRGLIAITLLAGVSSLCSSAQAGLVATASIDGGAPVTIINVGSATTTAYSNASLGGVFNVDSLTIGSNSPGTASLADLISSQFNITNLGTASHTIELVIGDVGFTQPIAPPTIILNSHIGGSVTGDGANNVMTFQTWVDPANGQNTVGGGGEFTSGLQTMFPTTGSFDSDARAFITSLAGPYSITEDIVITLNGGSSIGFRGTSTLAPAPEPASMIVWSLGACGFGIVAMRRRKAARNTAA